MPLQDVSHLVGVTMAGNDDQHVAGLEWNPLPFPLFVQRVSLGGEGNGGAHDGSGECAGESPCRQDPAYPKNPHSWNRESHDRHACDGPDRCTDGDPFSRPWVTSTSSSVSNM